MAAHNTPHGFSAKAGADLTAGLCKFVVFDSSGNLIVNTTANGKVAGVLAMNAPSSAVGTPVTYNPLFGQYKVLSAATLAAGDYIESDNAGKAVAWADTADHICLGQVIEGGASGDYITVAAVSATGGS